LLEEKVGCWVKVDFRGGGEFRGPVGDDKKKKKIIDRCDNKGKQSTQAH
jgi:hypothetical protein